MTATIYRWRKINVELAFENLKIGFPYSRFLIRDWDKGKQGLGLAFMTPNLESI